MAGLAARHPLGERRDVIGVVPQQPPTIDTPCFSTNSCRASASGSGSAGKIVSPSGPWMGMPALGMQCTGTGEFSPR